MNKKLCIEKICRLPIDSEAQNKSAYALALESNFTEFHKIISLNDIEKYLYSHSYLIEEWLIWSEDKRTSGGYYFIVSQYKYSIGEIDSVGNKTFEKSFYSKNKACAEFILREISTYLDLNITIEQSNIQTNKQMEKLHNLILRISIWPVWLAFFIADLVFNIYVMNKASETLKTVCGDAVKIPDLEIGYSGDQLRNMIAFMNPECRVEFQYIATVTDSIYPFVYGLFFFFSIVILYYKTNVPAPKFKLYVFPLLTIFFDFLENASIVNLMQMQHHEDYLYHVASAFSMLKWFFAILSIMLIVVGLVRWLIYRFRKNPA